MKKVKKTLLLFLALTLTHKAIRGQDFSQMPEVKSSLVPVAGSESYSRGTAASSFQEVDYFTGKASINIPIFNKSYGSVQMNIGLGYASSGLTMLAFPSEIGAGWDLSTGFSLSRIVNGNADDEYDQGNLYVMTSTPGDPPECRQRALGYLRNNTLLPLTEQSNGTDIKNFYLANHDAELDVFTVTLNGKSVKFVIGKNSEVFPLSPCDWKIEYNYNSQYVPYTGYAPNSYIDRFTITDEQGNKYFFRALGYYAASTVVFCTLPETCMPTSGYINNARREAICEWEIEKIKTYNGQEIQFNYFNRFSDDSNLFREAAYTYTSSFRSVIPSTGGYCYAFPNDQSSFGTRRFSANIKPYLSSVIMPDGVSLDFLYGAVPRGDAMIYDPPINIKCLPLKEIRLSRYGNPSTFYNFYQSYFNRETPGGTTAYNSNSISPDGGQSYLRLKLDSIIVSPDDQNMGYRFEYDMSLMLPDRKLSSIDHWGYYNNRSNSGLLPIDEILGGVAYPNSKPYEGNRAADATAVTANMIKKITFGDNSSVAYEFEANAGKYYDFYTGLEQNITVGGGARLKKITTFDGINHTNDIVKKLEYKLDNGISSGMLFAKPIYRKPFECIDHGSTIISTTNSLVTSYGYTKNGSSIGYSQVTVIYGEGGEGGKEKYQYSNIVDGTDVNIIPGATPDLPFANRQYLEDWNIGLLKSRKIYTSSNTLVREENNEYSTGSTLPQTASLPYFRSLKYEIKKGDPRGITNDNCNSNIPWDFYKAEYYPRMGYALLSKKTVTEYLSGGEFTTATEYTYNGRHHLSKDIKLSSEGKYLENRYYRVYDYIVNGANPAFDNLISGNRSTEVVRTDNLLKDNINAPFKYIGSSINRYSNIFIDAGTGIYRVEPTEVYKLKASEPIDESLIGSSINPAQSLPSSSPYYYKDVTFQYNALAIATGVTKSEHSMAILNDGYDVIAEVKNATEQDVAYSSFENNRDGQGGWLLETLYFDNDGYSGKHSAKASRNPVVLQKNLNPLKTYTISMWAKSGTPVIQFNTGSPLTLSTSFGETTADGWKYYSGTFTGKTSCSIQSGSKVDEIRLYPVGALMKTYTYEPLSGILSECNEQNNVINYTYDFLGRLVEISDKNKKIVKQYKYGSGIQN